MTAAVWQPAYIGIGSNLDNPIDQVRRALDNLNKQPGLSVVTTSHLVRNPPFDKSDQPIYVNAVTAVLTTLEPESLLDILQHLENQQGRVRTHKQWESRTIDLDILVYSNRIIDTKRLSVPHPHLFQRSFVLGPLNEIAPDLTVPTMGRVSDLIKQVCLDDLEPV